MKANNETTLKTVLETLKETLPQIENPVAAFDADGTLWPIDMGETFFSYQINNQLVELPEKPWEYYLNMHAERPRDAYLWLAQINKGQKLSQVQAWAQQACDEKNVSVFNEQKEIISFLHDNNVDVYIVTASVKWAVEPAAKLYNIPASNVIGIVTDVNDGVVSDVQGGPITYREGKVAALIEKTGQKHFYGSGNTMGDISLLEEATHMKLSVSSAPEDDSNYKSEQTLKKISTDNKWFQFEY